MTRSLIAATVLAALSMNAAQAATAASAPAKATAKKSTHAAPKAAAKEPEAPLSEGQLAVAGRVMTGMAECELNQKVDVVKEAEVGHFKITWGKQSWTMVPEETTTGAVVLVDKAHGMEWLQIPAKSMLLDKGHGKRLVTECKESGQG